MNYLNFFKRKNIFVVGLIFFTLSIFNIIYCGIVQRGLIYDGVIWFINILDKMSDNEWCFMFWSFYRPRGFTNFINELPMNMAYHIFGISSKNILAFIFSLPLFLFPFLATIQHYILAKKSKRYDIVIFSIFLYSFFIIPISMYSIFEGMLAASVFFLLFHYLISNIDYNIKDILILILLILISYNSHECNACSGLLMFFMSLFYAKKSDTKRKKVIKYFIGINALLMSIYYSAYYFFVPPDFLNTTRLTADIESLKYFLSQYPFYIYLFFLFVLMLTIFKKKHYNIKEIILLSFSLIAAFLYILFNNLFFNNAFFVMRYFLFPVLPFLMIICFFIDIKNVSHNKYKINLMYSNILIIVLLFGILNTVIQVNNSYWFDRTKKNLTEKIEMNKNNLISPNYGMGEDFYKQIPCSIFYICDTYTYDSIAFQNRYYINKLITIDEKNAYCPSTFYFIDDNLVLNFSTIKIKNKFWDMTNIYDEVRKNEKLANKYYKHEIN